MMWRMLRGRRGCAVVHSLSRAWLLVTLWTAAHQASLCFTISQNLFKLMSIESMMLYKHVILCHTLLFLLSIFPSIRDFSSESALHIRQPRYWSYSFNISPFKEFSGLISFWMDWLDLLVVWGTRKNLLQHYSLKASNLRYSDFFMVQLSHPCMTIGSAFFIVQLSHPQMTTGKNIALTIWTFVSKVMSMLFNMLSRLVIACLPRSKCLLIPWLQSSSRDFGAQENSLSLFPHLFAMKWWNLMPWS